MQNEILFSERQRINKWLLLFISISSNGLFVAAFISQVVYGHSVGNNPMSDEGLAVIAGFTILLSVFLYSIKLETVITKEAITVRFFPVHVKYRVYPWSEILQVTLRKYSPIMEYGGWGIRGFKRNRALNVQGNEGIQLTFENGKKLLIGTQKSNEVADVLNILSK